MNYDDWKADSPDEELREIEISLWELIVYDDEGNAYHYVGDDASRIVHKTEGLERVCESDLSPLNQTQGGSHA